MPDATLAAARSDAGLSGARNQLAELVWLRSLTGAGRAYLEDARSERVVSFDGLRRTATLWSALLSDLGVGAGATVGIAAADPMDFAPAFLSTIASGRVAAPLDAGSPDRELAAAATRAGPAVVVADRPAPAGSPCEWVTLAPGSFDLGATAIAGGRALTNDAAGLADHPDIGPATGPGGLLLSTSGTTGRPKLILLSDTQLLHTAGWIAQHHELSVLDRGFNPLPLFHVNAEVVGLLATLAAGSTLVLDRRFRRLGLWDLLCERHVTWVNAVPAIVARLAPLGDDEAVPPTLRFVRSASAPLAPAVATRFEQATGVGVVETYGMTEAGSQITANPLGGPRKPGSVGRPVGTQVRVVAGRAHGTGAEPVPEGAVGRVEIRGRGVIGAYAGPGYEDRIDAHGWLDTGDLGHLDADGFLYLDGRVDDVINRGGEKIFPREVEEVILGDPDVLAVAVVGWDHHELGRVPVAYLVARGVRGADERARAEQIVERVRQLCIGSLSRPKRPVAFHVLESLPAGSTGKVQRHKVDLQASIYSLLVR